MSRGNSNCLEASIERSRGPEKSGTDASTTSAQWVPRISHEILRDLGMSDDAIAQYFCRFRPGRSEQFVQMVLHEDSWIRRGCRGHIATKELYHGQKRTPHRADGERNAV
jgi:hypothetical protein